MYPAVMPASVATSQLSIRHKYYFIRRSLSIALSVIGGHHQPYRANRIGVAQRSQSCHRTDYFFGYIHNSFAELLWKDLRTNVSPWPPIKFMNLKYYIPQIEWWGWSCDTLQCRPILTELVRSCVDLVICLPNLSLSNQHASPIISSATNCSSVPISVC